MTAPYRCFHPSSIDGKCVTVCPASCPSRDASVLVYPCPFVEKDDETRRAVWSESPWIPKQPDIVLNTWSEHLWRNYVVFAYEQTWTQELCA